MPKGGGETSIRIQTLSPGVDAESGGDGSSGRRRGFDRNWRSKHRLDLSGLMINKRRRVSD